MNVDQLKTQLVARLTAWRYESVVVEFSAGMAHVSGLWMLIDVSETELQFAFDPFAHPHCDFGLRLDEAIVNLSLDGFEEAAERILGKTREHLEPEEHCLLAGKSVEQVADVRFCSGGRLLLGLVRRGWGTSHTSKA